MTVPGARSCFALNGAHDDHGQGARGVTSKRFKLVGHDASTSELICPVRYWQLFYKHSSCELWSTNQNAIAVRSTPLQSAAALSGISGAAARCTSDPIPASAPSCMRTTAARGSACAGRSWPSKPTRAARSLSAIIRHTHAHPACSMRPGTAPAAACASRRL